MAAAGAAGTSYTGMQGNTMPNAGYAGAPPPQQQRGASLQDMVLQFFQNHADTEAGETANSCYDAMKAQGVQAGQVRDAVECLVAEGLLYSTIDDDHFKST